MKKKFVIIIIILLSLTAFSIYYFLEKPIQIFQKLPQNQAIHPPCLGDDEIVTYEVKKKKTPLADIIIHITDKKAGKEISSFRITDIFKTSTSIESHRCGIYVIKFFNYDPEKSKQNPGFRAELWRYEYNGEGRNILLLAEKDKNGVFRGDFDYDFRVDPMEIYIALVQSYSEIPENIGYYFKNQQTREDSFTLSYSSILKINPDLDGYLGLENWTKSGSYFWGDIFAGAPRLGYVRIKRDSWEYDVLPAPAGTLGGTAFNPEYSYITYDTGPGWIGIDVITEQVHDEWRKEGKIVEVHLYNLFTKKDILLATSTEPSWNGKPQWISDTELQYELPNGEKKIYKINED